MLKLSKSNGITLIALIITIIIMLILAGVSISVFTGSGLFGQAIRAKEKAKIAEYEELISLAKTEAIFENNYPGNEQKSILERIVDILSHQETFSAANFEIKDNTLTIITS